MRKSKGGSRLICLEVTAGKERGIYFILGGFADCLAISKTNTAFVTFASCGNKKTNHCTGRQWPAPPLEGKSCFQPNSVATVSVLNDSGPSLRLSTASHPALKAVKVL